jgi:hypothetical protein
MIYMDVKTFKDKNVTEKINHLILTLEENGFYMDCNIHKKDIQKNICFIKGNSSKSLHIHISDMSVYYCNLRIVFYIHETGISGLSAEFADLSTVLDFVYSFNEVLYPFLEKELNNIFKFKWEACFDEEDNIHLKIFRLEAYKEIEGKNSLVTYYFDERLEDKYFMEITRC